MLPHPVLLTTLWINVSPNPPPRNSPSPASNYRRNRRSISRRMEGFVRMALQTSLCGRLRRWAPSATPPSGQSYPTAVCTFSEGLSSSDLLKYYSRCTAVNSWSSFRPTVTFSGPVCRAYPARCVALEVCARSAFRLWSIHTLSLCFILIPTARRAAGTSSKVAPLCITKCK